MGPHGGVAPSFKSIVWSKVHLGSRFSAFLSVKRSLYCQYSFGNPSNSTSFSYVAPILPIIVAFSSNASVSSHSNLSAIASSSTGFMQFACSKRHCEGVSIFFIGCSWCHHPKGMMMPYFPPSAISQETIEAWPLVPISNLIGWD